MANYEEDEQFKAFISQFPETHWSKKDISAVRLGWEGAKEQLQAGEKQLLEETNRGSDER